LKRLSGVEHVHAFTRTVWVGNPREFLQAEKKSRRWPKRAKRLIKNCIICWNYLYLSQKLAEIDDPAKREAILKALAHGSAAAWGHINLLGEYDFSEEKLKDTGVLGDEQFQFIEAVPRIGQSNRPPEPPLTVGLDGGYVHASDQKSRTEGWFELIAGKSVQTDGGAKVLAFANTYDTEPKRRLYEVLKSQGLQMNRKRFFLFHISLTGRNHTQDDRARV
jgi:hypothetical protein